MQQVLCCLFLSLFLLGCNSETGQNAPTADPPEAPLHRLRGKAMGSYYRVTYIGQELPGLKSRIDSLLEAYNQELSAWVPESRLSAFNASAEGVDLSGTVHFIPNLELARRVSEASGGAFDPTIGPLVKYWGFGTGRRRESSEVDPAEVAALLELVDMDKVRLEGNFLRKDTPGIQLDLNASAKGYGVDLIHELLNKLGRPNHLVDIGGEMRGGGSKYGRPWRVAIRLPEEDRDKVASAGTLPLGGGKAMATSGNYLNYYKVNGETFSHTINPTTGLTERNALLSATVLAADCATADAFATACMVLGPEAALGLVEEQAEIEAYFLVRAENGALATVKSSGLEE